MEKPVNLDLEADHLKVILELIKSHIPNTTVWAYGSRITGRARRYSDLDLVAFSSSNQSRQIANLKEAFEESCLPFRVELLVWDDIPNSFHREILSYYVELISRCDEISDDPQVNNMASSRQSSKLE